MIDIKELKSQLSLNDVEKIIQALGIEKYEKTNSFILMPTVCHNLIDDTGSMKLYYYDNNKLCHCYTECGESFDIIELVQKVKNINGDTEFSFIDALNFILSIIKFTPVERNYNKYNSVKDKYISNTIIQLEEYKDTVLEVFEKRPIVQWLQEGISQDTLDKFNISFYNYQNKIVIPHYDINNRLIGIRGRALEKEDIERRGKYTPLTTDGIMYKHPLSLNLYGLNLTKDGINKMKTVVIFEGEKSVMLLDSALGENNYSVATCGSSLNQNQINILIKQCNVNNIVLAYDKEYETFGTEKANKYYNKLYDMCKKYSMFCNFSFIFDFNNLLSEKQSPIDARLQCVFGTIKK